MKDRTEINDTQNLNGDFFTVHYNEETEATSVKFNLPLGFSFHRKPSNEEIAHQLSEHFRTRIGTIADFMSIESHAMQTEYAHNPAQVMATAAAFEEMADLIRGYSELQELLKNHIEKMGENKNG